MTNLRAGELTSRKSRSARLAESMMFRQYGSMVTTAPVFSASLASRSSEDRHS